MTDYPTIGPYTLSQAVGEGGQGSVWLAKDRRDGRVVALKVLRRESTGPTEIARFRREAAILTALRDPGLPACLQVVEQDGKPIALAMEYVKGTPLSEMRQQRRIAPREVQAVGCELSRIVSVLHGKGLVHRDLKAANILLRQGWESGIPGSVVVVDLGIAKGTSHHATAYTDPGFVIGSASYLAPEYLLGSPSSEASTTADVFSMGVLLWLMLFGRHPTGLPLRAPVVSLIHAYESNVLSEPNDALVRSVEKCVPGLAEVVRRCVAFLPSCRFANAREVHVALTTLQRPDGSTQLCVEPPIMSYPVAIHPPSGPISGAARPLGGLEDSDSETTTNVRRQAPAPEPTVDEPMSETLLELRRQLAGSPDFFMPAPRVPAACLPPPLPSSVPPPPLASASRPPTGLPESGTGSHVRTMILVGLIVASLLGSFLLGLLAYLVGAGKISLGW